MVGAMKSLCSASGAVAPAIPAGNHLPSSVSELASLACAAKPGSIGARSARRIRPSSSQAAFALFQFAAKHRNGWPAFRKLFQDAVKTEDGRPSVAGKDSLELGRVVHGMTGQAGIAGLNRTAQISSALEALLKELHDKPKYIQPVFAANRRADFGFYKVLMPGTAEDHETGCISAFA